MRARARIAVAGVGRMGLVHARNVREHIGAAELVLVIDSDAQRARRAGQLLEVPHASEFEASIKAPDVDAVVLATPTAAHVGMIEAAARCGKHVLVEKPISFDPDSTARAIAAAHRCGIRLQVGFHRRFDPDWRHVRQRIASGALGALRLLRVAHRNRAPAASIAPKALGDPLIDMAIHDFDTALWIGGPIAEVTTVCSRPAGADTMAPDASLVTTIRFRDGALGIIDNTRAAAYGFECSAEILGVDGAVRVGIHQRPFDVEWLSDGRSLGELAREHDLRHRTAYRAELEHFVRVVLGDTEPEPTGTDGLAAFLVTEAARASLLEGRPAEVRTVCEWERLVARG
jgi:predicted dehydrogenase